MFYIVIQRCLSCSGERSQLLDSTGWLSAGESLSQQCICVIWVFLDTDRSWSHLQCGSVSALLGRTVPSWASFFYSPVICPRQFAWVRGCWFIKFFCARWQFLPSSIIAIFFPPYIHACLLYQVEHSSEVEACSHPTLTKQCCQCWTYKCLTTPGCPQQTIWGMYTHFTSSL